MFAFKLIQLIETRAEPLSEGLMHRLKKNDRCIELLQRVPSEELRRRSHEIYRNLNDWLAEQDRIGDRRAVHRARHAACQARRALHRFFVGH